MAEIQVLRGDEIVHARPIGHSPVYVGRAASNDVVIADKQVSSRHAVVFVEAGRYRVDDLGSKNGTFVNGERINGPTSCDPGATIRLGTGNIQLRLSGEPPAIEGMILGALAVEDVAVAVRHTIRADRFGIGSDASCQLRIPSGPALAATIVVHALGEARLVTDDDDVALEIDEPFEVSGHTLCLRLVREATSGTEGVESTKYGYRLRAALEAGAGPEAVVEEPGTGKRYRIDTENRATLLWVLAKKLADDRAAGLADADRGWCTDDDVATGVWGRDRNKFDPNNYHVLVCRLRKELRDAGFDPLFIEKRRKHIRLRLDDVTVE